MREFELTKKLGILLHLKHWQIFLLFFSPLILLGLFAFMITVVPISSDILLLINPILMLAFTFLYFGLVWVYGVNLHKKLPKDTNMKIRRFKLFFSITAVYPIVFFTITFLLFFEINVLFLLFLFFIIAIPLHLFVLFSSVYTFIFMAKELRSVEMQKEATFRDYVETLILLSIFFPLGVWIIQPKINKIFSNEKTGTIQMP